MCLVDDVLWLVSLAGSVWVQIQILVVIHWLCLYFASDPQHDLEPLIKFVSDAVLFD